MRSEVAQLVECKIRLKVEGLLVRRHCRHCVVSLSKSVYLLLSSVSTNIRNEGKHTDMTEKLLTGM